MKKKNVNDTFEITIGNSAVQEPTSVTTIANEDSLIENKTTREQYIDRMEVLDKVKELFLIPQMECMTIRQVAEYFEVDLNTLKQVVKRNEDEFLADGALMQTPKDFKFLKGTSCPFKKLEQQNGKLIVQLSDTVTLEIPNRGIRVFPKRAILRMGMLLRDSRVAKEIRTQLLNVIEKVEETQPEVLTTAIDEEQSLLLNIGQAYGTGDFQKILLATSKLDQFRKRHIEKLETVNAQLIEDKKILTDEILHWSDRKFCSAVVRKMAFELRLAFSEAWGMVYKNLKYKYGINLKSRAGGKKPYIQHLREDEYPMLQKTIAAILEQNQISPAEFFKEVNSFSETQEKNVLQ